MTVYGEIQEERGRQDEKWGGPDHDDHHNLYDWLNFVGRRLNTMGMDPNQKPYTMRKLWVEVAALAVAAIESIDRKLRVPEVVEEENSGT